MAVDMDSAPTSRIFVRALPPTITEDVFRRHFGQKGIITDVKLFPQRRIGYVGYKTPEEAQRATKYFNKTFIRMSRIGVELARPTSTDASKKSVRDDAHQEHEDPLEQKRSSESKGDAQDPKLKEFLDAMKPKSKRKAWEIDDEEPQAPSEEAIVAGDPGESDDEYEHVPKKAKRTAQPEPSAVDEVGVVETSVTPPDLIEDEIAPAKFSQQSVSDVDWARSKTSRLLGLLDDEEEEEEGVEGSQKQESLDSSDVGTNPPEPNLMNPNINSLPTPPYDQTSSGEPIDSNVEAVKASMRLFVRNLSYDVQQADLEIEFEKFGHLEEIHVAVDKKTGIGKGFAFVQYSDSDSAAEAFLKCDKQIFQGRLLHVLPAQPKRERLDDDALAKLPLKTQQDIKKKRQAATTRFNWNSLYMNADAVVSSVADKLGLTKTEVLDPTSGNAAVKQAHAETHVIQETKSYFRQQGVDLDSFKKSARGDTAILVKNIPYDFGRDELRQLFAEQGDVARFLMPPSGTVAIVKYANPAQCKAAYRALAYRKVKSSMLFLEKAPKDIFAAEPSGEGSEQPLAGRDKISTADLKEIDQVVPDTGGSATLFVRNLNFSTSTEQLRDTFKTLDGFISGRVKTKTDPKKPGQILSMGFGFLEFRTAQQAQAALLAMDGYSLAGHKLQIRASHKGTDAAEERRKANAEKRAAGTQTKVVIKNLPFEATKKDVRELFGAYGKLRSVRVPKKMDRAARGFAFADFTTAKEAQNAVEALRDTHLLGRRLVLDFAVEDPEDAEAEIEKMQQKVGAQVNKVALQKLTSGGRKKFTTLAGEEET